MYDLALLARSVVLAGVLAIMAPSAAGTSVGRSPPGACPPPKAQPAYANRIRQALSSTHDLWGEKLIAAPGGPTYEGARRYVAPLLYAKGPAGLRLDTSGVYYLPFSFPFNIYDPVSALHVADGSEIISRRIDGRSLTFFVGSAGRERYGSCLARLRPAQLADGYLPILETAYVDRGGVRYRQESFVGRVYGARAEVSFVHLTVDARRSRAGAVVRLVPSTRGLSRVGQTLASGSSTQLLFSAGGAFDGTAVRYVVRSGRLADVYVDWVNRPVRTHALRADRRTYRASRRLVARFWRSRLAGGAQYIVPERRVLNAERSLLIQQHVLGSHYSAGNPYEELSFAEVLDDAEVMAEYHFGNTAKAILRETLRALPGRLTNWRAGEQLVAGALYFRLFRDRRYVDEATPELAHIVDGLAQQIEQETDDGLLHREAYSSDISRRVYGLHAQATVCQGLFVMARVWAETGHARLAARSYALAVQLDTNLRLAVGASMQRLPDGSLFVPVALLDDCAAFDRLTASREGSYWNLVMPYALASGFFAPHGAEAEALLRYLLDHGSRLLGVVRGRADVFYRDRAQPASGFDEVYGLSVSRFLADNDRPDQIVLSLYGMLAAAMTPNTFITGESSTMSPLGGAYFRAMYLPPNLGGNATFLETLRLILIHETRKSDGTPRGLELAFSTPRAWLSGGKTILVRDAPTSFGPVSYSITRHGRVVHVTVAPPASPAPTVLRLRLRLPAGERIGAIRTVGRRLVRFDAKTGTIDLTGRSGRVELYATVTR
jgi:hypothetical protein